MSNRWHTLARLTALLALPAALLLAAGPYPGARASVQKGDNLPRYIRDNYTRHDYRIPMRDGARLYTVSYAPREIGRGARRGGQTCPLPFSMSNRCPPFPRLTALLALLAALLLAAGPSRGAGASVKKGDNLPRYIRDS